MPGPHILAGIGQALSSSRPDPIRQQIADGIYLFRTAPYGDVGLDGNSIVIIGSDGVLVFDTNGTPSAAAAVLAQVRTLTSQPVRYVVNSHWHWDHWYGTEVYTKAFPDATVIAHEKTKMLMAGPALDFNRPGLEQQLPAYLAQLEQRIEKAEAATPPPANLPQLKQALADGKFFLEQKNSVHHTLPNQTYTGKLTLKLGDREIQVLHQGSRRHAGRFVPVSAEGEDRDRRRPARQPGLVCTELIPDGLDHDTRVHRLARCLDHRPRPRRAAARRNAPQEHDRADEGPGEARRRREGARPGSDAARAEIMPQIKELMMAITGDQPAVNRAFEIQLVDWFLHRVYDELNGPLTDAIAPIPPK